MLFPIRDYNPTRRTAYLTIVLIALNVGVFFYQSALSPKPFEIHIAESAMIPKEITHFTNYEFRLGQDHLGRIVYFKRSIPPFVSIITSMFMHGSWMHLLGNMLFLWIFGNNIEDNLGRGRFVLFYLLSGIGASLVHVVFHWNSMVPVVGASGAVSGIMGAYLILFPKARVRTLVFIVFFVTFIDIPAFAFLIIWFVMQFLYLGTSGIAWMAHVGGFILGIYLLKLLRKKRPLIEILQ
jgi:membrane associated rhomboid family serine protease